VNVVNRSIVPGSDEDRSESARTQAARTEAARLAAIRRYDILDTPPEGAFDRITAIAARRLDVPVSIISIVDTNRIWFKSHHGLDINEIALEAGLCATAIYADEPYIVTDALTDARARENSLVTSAFGLRFYCGIPLQTSQDERLGTLCVVDNKPRNVTAREVADLQDLASVVMDQLELRISARRAIAHANLMAKEIDHRVMNSLQFISSMLSLQSRAAGLHDSIGNHLQIAANRVAAVAQVHRNFYVDGAEETPCLAFLHRLCNELSQILGRDIEVTGDEASIPTAQVQSIGLIVNELATNAAKHGAGKISVIHKRGAHTRTLTVCDQGPGLPPNFDLESSNSLGMKVLASLVRQLKGQFTTGPQPACPSPACFTVTIPR
jgi:two-component sensor histidine kinase